MLRAMSGLAATRPSSSEQRTLPLPELLTTREVAEALRVDARTIERWAEQGRLPRIQIAPKTVRYRVEDVAALIRPTKATSPPHASPSRKGDDGTRSAD
jgi:excisionase family DNA binding protein